MHDVIALVQIVPTSSISEFAFLLDDTIENGVGGTQALGILNSGSSRT